MLLVICIYYYLPDHRTWNKLALSCLQVINKLLFLFRHSICWRYVFKLQLNIILSLKSESLSIILSIQSHIANWIESVCILFYFKTSTMLDNKIFKQPRWCCLHLHFLSEHIQAFRVHFSLPQMWLAFLSRLQNGPIYEFTCYESVKCWYCFSISDYSFFIYQSLIIELW